METTRLLSCALVFTGAGLGGVLRYGLGSLISRLLGTSFPYGTLAINVLGGLILGLLVGLWAGQGGNPSVRLFLVIGVLGGFTTFSTFTLETVLLIEKNQLTLAAAYILASVAGAVVALVVGLWLGRYLAS